MSTGRAAAALVVLLGGLAWAGSAQARGAQARGGQARGGQARAPVGPPLVTSDGSEAGAVYDAAGADASSSAPASGGDPLERNGLGSPLCADAGQLAAASRRNCATSGFEAAAAPTGDYGLDVHIDTGLLGLTAATLEQDYLIGPVWMGLVWAAHALIVALEWGFTLDLLGGSAMGSIERSLRGTETAFTQPWLAPALAIAALVAAYDGLVRRRVAQTLGQAALMLTMMAAGLWVIADPAGTVGVLGRWVDEASTGTVGAVVSGTPNRASRTLAGGMGELFAGVVGEPWCYLEFGDVGWCTEPGQLDPRLRAAALRLAAGAQAPAKSGCDGGGEGAGVSAAVCQALAGQPPGQLAQSGRLLREAHTNGELFLALPANEAARNSINDSASLLGALCGSDDATGCRGATAAQAEFRTQSGTAARLGGLLLIVLGALGALLLFGYIALQLLGAELLALLYLLLAPAAVIAPALGDGGRGAFRAWAGRLAGALTAKLLFSFVLGVVLLLSELLLGLGGLGWWTRWLLAAAMWWGAFLRRHRLLGPVPGDARRPLGALRGGTVSGVLLGGGLGRGARGEGL